jgi:5-methylcytosine-specific restriction protein A
MPMKPNSCCKYPGCPVQTPNTYCDRHRPNTGQNKPDYHKLYKRKRWRRARERYLNEHPFCKHCKKEGRLRSATVVDHIKPHRGNKKLFWDRSNWQSLCTQCHNKKSAKGK